MTTPNNITSLRDNEVFVFGSNLNGNHAGGAALLAKDFGAEDGIGEGMTGQCYAFPTLDKDMQKVSIEDLIASKERLYETAEENKDKTFYVTKVGCGIAGFSEGEMKEVFKGDKPSNVILPAGWAIIKGYKAFDKGLVCRGMQYEFGKDHYHDGEIEICASGLHFCKNLSDVYQYYDYNEDLDVCEIESEGDVIDEENGNKSVTNHIRLVRLLNAEQKSNNNGSNNTGHSNVGDRNAGNRNVGDWNVGNWNVGDRNAGNSNVGDRNAGNRNVGDRNAGNRNVGDRNAGNRNVGDWNVGDRNAGNWNAGNRNVGDRNAGNWNVGDWNKASFHVGSFNTIDAEEILVFNKMCKKSDWDNAEKPSCLYFNTKQWVDYSEMTEEEKENNKSAKTCGGYLKPIDYKEAFTKSMENASKEDIEAIKKLPNFDSDLFFDISGFRIN